VKEKEKRLKVKEKDQKKKERKGKNRRTRRKCHLRESCWVPSREDDASIGGVLADLADALGQLVHTLPLVVLVAPSVLGTKVSPLEPVSGANVSFGIVGQSSLIEELTGAIAVPNAHALGGQLLGVGRP